MHRAALRLLACSLLLGVPVARASAQSDTMATAPAPPYHVAFVESSATLIRAGDVIPCGPGEPLVDGDRVQTPTGRLELRGPAGERIFLDQGSTLDILQPPVFRLVSGAARVVLSAPGRDDGAPEVEIDTPHATAALFEAGDYRLSLLQRSGSEETELIVRSGRGELINMHGRVPVAADHRATASAFGAPTWQGPLADGDLVDSFDRWVDQALTGTAPTASAVYLPAELGTYSAALDTAGSWSYEPTYGHVWYPTVVASWQPYYHGFWRPLGYYGYTWVSHTPWAWATHHYGRWEFGVRGWFWIPGTAWASAWVSWGVGPGYVAWCPLGWGNRPVYPTPFGRHYGRPGLYRDRGGRDWPRGGGGWTLLRAAHFRTGAPVSRHAADWRSLGPTEHAAFVQQQTAPRVHLAVPRGSPSALRAQRGASEPAGQRRLTAAAGRSPATETTDRRLSPSPGTRTASSADRPQWAASSRNATGPAPERAARRDGLPLSRGTAGGAVGQERAYTRVPGSLSSAGRERTVSPQRPLRDGTRGETSVARPRWTPPPTHYGIPPAGTSGRLAATAPVERRSGGSVRTEPRPVRPQGSSRVYGSSPSPRSAPRAVQRESGAGRARVPVMRAPAAQSAPPRAPSASRPATVGRSQPGSSGSPRGQAVPRGGAPRRPPSP